MTTVRELPYGDQVALPPDVPLFIKPVKQSWFWGLFRRDDPEDGEHLFCPCSPKFTLCGAFDPDPDVDWNSPIDGSECQDCLKVNETAGCPRCGCKPRQSCRLCDWEQ